MTLLSQRQQSAERLARELQQFGANVTSLLPLTDGRHLRFWVSDYKKREVLQQLKDAGYEPLFLGMQLQPCVQSYDLELVNNFELALPVERTPIHDDRTVRGEISKPKKTDLEMKGMRKYLGLE